MAAQKMTDKEHSYFEQLEPYRRELHAHCYRMLGSVHDAEDAVQETLVNAWRGLDRFERRSSPRTWLYAIATNVCVRMIERRPARLLPVDYGPAHDPHEPLAAPVTEPVWLEPYPDTELGAGDGPAGAPDTRYEQREAIELAFIAALQHLPARQRAVLILRDVLGFSGVEVAGILDTTPTSIYSLLQRANATLDTKLPSRSQQATLRSLGDDALSALVGRYIRAWEGNDVDALVELLTEDVSVSMPPTPSWIQGRDATRDFLRSIPLSGTADWRLVPTSANGQVAMGEYKRDETGTYRAFGVVVLTLRDNGVSGIFGYHDASVLPLFGLPEALTA
jgi:RNA polymerase sigma-70 factor (ECF subfamily)